MSEEVRKIIDQLQVRINEANQKADSIIADAERRAKEIFAEAKATAEKKIKAAEEEISQREKAHQEKLKQAVRDTIIDLKNKTIQAILKKSFDASLEKPLNDPNIVGNAVLEMAQQFAKNYTTDLRVILGPELFPKLATALKQEAHKVIKNNLVIEKEGTVKGGFKIGVAAEGYVYDFSLEALTELFSTAYGAQIEAQIFAGEK
jgi:vacuolar-type H+-ATPase subunit E/Vma4